LFFKIIFWKNKSVITVPNKLVLGVSRAQQLGALGTFIRSDERVNHSPVVVLALSLLYERSIGAKSTWKVSQPIAASSRRS
jgi:hypothetical protein